MLIYFEKTEQFAPDDFTATGHVLPGALLRRFEDIGLEHVNSLGFGFGSPAMHGLIWVLTKLRFRTLRQPEPERDYSLSTYPHPQGTRIFDRDYYVSDSDGILVAADSQWCTINYSTRKIEQFDFSPEGEYSDEYAFPDRIPRLRLKDLTKAASYTVTDSDIDRNNHMNNRRYVEIALNALRRPDADALTVNFARETKPGDEIELRVSGDGTAVTGELADGSQVFSLLVG